MAKINSLMYPLKLDVENMEQEILKPYVYMRTTPSTNLRAKFINLLGQWLTVPEDKLAIIHAYFHNICHGFLLLDDIMDKSVLRRGIPTAYNVYGTPRTVIAANWMFSRIYNNVHELNDPQLSQMFFKVFQMAFAGQGTELYWREKNICPTEAEYLQMVYKKTSLLFLSTVRAMNACSTGKKINAEKMLTNLGLYCQLSDDYHNLCNQDYFDSKGFCEDLTEGKFSFPIVHAVNNFPKEGKIIKNILAKRTYNVEVKKHCISILEKCGSFEYTRSKIQEVKNIIFEEARKIDPNPLLEMFVEMDLLTIINCH